MKIRRGCSSKNFPVKGFSGCWPSFARYLEIVLYGIPKGFFDFLNGFSLEGNNIASIDNFTVEYFRVVVELHMTYVALVFHHSLIPFTLKNLRTDFTVPRSVSFCRGEDDERSPESRSGKNGYWGPPPSSLSAPSERKRDSMSAQRMFALYWIVKDSLENFTVPRSHREMVSLLDIKSSEFFR